MANQNESICDIIRVEGVNAKGYGTIPKAVMVDCRLPVTAKAIYSYFCSFSGAGSRAFPHVSKILRDLQISKNYYYKQLKQLKDCDYIRVTQERVGGKYTRNIYTLVPCPSARYTAPCTTTGDTVTSDIYINTNKKKKSSIPISQSGDMTEDFISVIRQNIDYDALCYCHNKKITDNIVTIISDTLASKANTVRINGADVDIQTVKKRYLSLGNSDVSAVIAAMSEYAGSIRNVKNYLLTALYNAPATSEMFWKTEINGLMKEHSRKKGG